MSAIAPRFAQAASFVFSLLPRFRTSTCSLLLTQLHHCYTKSKKMTMRLKFLNTADFSLSSEKSQTSFLALSHFLSIASSLFLTNSSSHVPSTYTASLLLHYSQRTSPFRTLSNPPPTSPSNSHFPLPISSYNSLPISFYISPTAST